MKISNINKCSLCGEDYTWVYLIPNEMGDPHFDVEKQIKDATYVRCLEEDNNTYTFVCDCPHCGKQDHFKYEVPIGK